MSFYLNEDQREKTTVAELARYILQGVKDSQFSSLNPGQEDKLVFSQSKLLRKLCQAHRKHSNSTIQQIIDESDPGFSVKFSEAIALLKRRGLLMFKVEPEKVVNPDLIRLTSIGERSDFQDGILIIVDDPEEIVDSLKIEVLELDPVVEQYYLQSLRAC